MVTGGTGPQGGMVELLSNNGSWLCHLPRFPENIKLHSQTGSLICGGFQPPPLGAIKTCQMFSDGLWKQTHKALEHATNPRDFSVGNWDKLYNTE